MHAKTQAIPENGGGGTDHDDIFREISGGGFGQGTIDEDYRFPGFAPPKAPGNYGSGGGGTNTTAAVGENGGGGGSTINRPGPSPYRDLQTSKKDKKFVERFKESGLTLGEYASQNNKRRKQGPPKRTEGYPAPDSPGGGTATTAAVGENGGGETISPPRRPSPGPSRPPGGDRGPIATTAAVGENGGGGSTIIDRDNTYPGPTPYTGRGKGKENVQDLMGRFYQTGGDKNRGPIATTGAVGEKGGGRRNPRPPKGPEGFPAPGSPGGGTATTMMVGENGGGGRQPRPKPQPTGGRSPRPNPKPTGDRSPRPNPSPSPGPKREARQEERSRNQDLRAKNQAARADKREERTERRAERADKKAQKAKAQAFKDKRMKRITGKDSMPNN